MKMQHVVFSIIQENQLINHESVHGVRFLATYILYVLVFVFPAREINIRDSTKRVTSKSDKFSI